MKTVHTDQIRDAIARMFQRSAVEMTDHVQEALQAGAQNESGMLAKKTLLLCDARGQDLYAKALGET